MDFETGNPKLKTQDSKTAQKGQRPRFGSHKPDNHPFCITSSLLGEPGLRGGFWTLGNQARETQGRPWENPGSTQGKPWVNQGKTLGKPWVDRNEARPRTQDPRRPRETETLEKGGAKRAIFGECDLQGLNIH